RGRRPGLAGGDDGPGRRQAVSGQRDAAPPLFLALLARARHHLGRAFHRGVFDGNPLMTETPALAKEGPSGVLVYTTGLVLAAIPFWAANTSLLWAPGVALGLAVLDIAQMGVHLVFFLHITTAPDNTNNVLALAFGLLIVFLVVAGSLWIMGDLNHNLMPAMPASKPMHH